MEAFVLAEKDAKNRRRVVLNATQVKAAQCLLNKAVPDLQRTEHTGADGGPIATRDDTPGLGGVKSALANMLARAAAPNAQ